MVSSTSVWSFGGSRSLSPAGQALAAYVAGQLLRARVAGGGLLSWCGCGSHRLRRRWGFSFAAPGAIGIRPCSAFARGGCCGWHWVGFGRGRCPVRQRRGRGYRALGRGWPGFASCRPAAQSYRAGSPCRHVGRDYRVGWRLGAGLVLAGLVPGRAGAPGVRHHGCGSGAAAAGAGGVGRGVFRRGAVLAVAGIGAGRACARSLVCRPPPPPPSNRPSGRFFLPGIFVILGLETRPRQRFAGIKQRLVTRSYDHGS